MRFMTMKPETMLSSLKRRFSSRYAVAKNGCWVWNAKTDHKGYGVIGYGLKQYRAHRISIFLLTGAFPSSFACHHCDNRRCVNPEHIFIGSAKDNMQDAKNKGRLATGEKHGRSRLTLIQIQKIREMIAEGKTQRFISDKIGVAQGHVSRIKNRVNWDV